LDITDLSINIIFQIIYISFNVSTFSKLLKSHKSKDFV